MANQKKTKPLSITHAQADRAYVEHDRFVRLVKVFQEQRERITLRCRTWLIYPRDAEDAVQETFLRAVRAWHRFRDECKIETWIYLISLNVCRNFNRRSKRRKTSAAVEYRDEISVSSQVNDQDRFTPAEAQLFRKEMMSEIHQAISELTESSQELLRLKIREGLTYDMIGMRLGIASGTVKSRVFRARNFLRDRVTFTEDHFV